MSIVKTSNDLLQNQLSEWSTQLDAISLLESGSSQRNGAVRNFVQGFVPVDVSEEDIAAFGETICSDEEFFGSMQREIRQCATGESVESITGNQRTRAVFTLRPLPGQLNGGGGSLDIVREVVFVFQEAKWRAEG
jgi:hypothetical protein